MAVGRPGGNAVAEQTATSAGQLREQVGGATDRLLATAAQLTDEQVKAPSLLPGWSRGHVLTHLARNADGLRNLLIWARTGVPTPQYASPQARDAAIAAGADRTAAEQAADIRDSAAAFDWYRRSAEGGYFRAQYNYATALAQRGEITAAADWFWRAGDDGTPEMRQAIATLLAGCGVPALVAVGERVAPPKAATSRP